MSYLLAEDRLRALVADGMLDPPQPGTGRTLERLRRCATSRRPKTSPLPA